MKTSRRNVYPERKRLIKEEGSLRIRKKIKPGQEAEWPKVEELAKIEEKAKLRLEAERSETEELEAEKLKIEKLEMEKPEAKKPEVEKLEKKDLVEIKNEIRLELEVKREEGLGQKDSISN